MSVIPLAEAQPGDLVFCHSSGPISSMIRSAEHFRRGWAKALGEGVAAPPGHRWNHVAILDVHAPGSAAGDPDAWSVIQAAHLGVTRHHTLSDLSAHGFYEIVRLPDTCDRAKVVAFARQEVGARYGYATIVSIFFTLLSPHFFNVISPGSWICSALAGESIRAGGWFRPWPDIYQVSPADLWCALVLERPANPTQREDLHADPADT